MEIIAERARRGEIHVSDERISKRLRYLWRDRNAVIREELVRATSQIASLCRLPGTYHSI